MTIGRLGSDLIPFLPLQETEHTEQRDGVELEKSNPVSSATQEASESAIPEQEQTSRVFEHSFSGYARLLDLQAQLHPTPEPQPAPNTAGTEIQPGVPVGMPAPEYQTLKLGSTGEQVVDMQKQLSAWRLRNNTVGIAADGKFGPITEQALKEFQKTYGLKPTGILDGQTRDRLKLESNANFNGLYSGVQDKIRKGFETRQTDPIGRENLLRFATDERFVRLSHGGQHTALSMMLKKPHDAAHTEKVLEFCEDRRKLELTEGLHDMDGATVQRLLDEMENNFDNKVARQNIVDLAKDPNFKSLTMEHQKLVLDKYATNPTQATFDSIQARLARPGFKQLENDGKTLALEVDLKAAQSEKLQIDLAKLEADPKYQSMSPRDQKMTLNLFSRTSPAGRTAVMGLLQKEINGTPALLNPSSDGTTTLEHLDRLTKANLDTRLVDASGAPQKKDAVLEDLLKELNEPSHNIDQRDRGTCTVTSMTNSLAEKNPAEYARLVTDLSTQGESTLANGDTVKTPVDAFLEDGSGRSVSERLLQSSLMNYGHPGYSNWDPGADGKRGTPDDGFQVPGTTRRDLDGYAGQGSGLTSAEYTKVLQGLYGKKYDCHSTNAIQHVEEALKQGKSPILTAVTWGDRTYGHMFEITKIEDGRIYFRNPWGPAGVRGSDGTTTGTIANNTDDGPIRRTEDWANAVESMSIEDYQRIVTDVAVQQ